MFAILIEQKLLTIIIILFLSLSIICQIIMGVIYQNMIAESDNMSTTNNKQLKKCKLKFANCYQLNGGVSNISIFVDKFISRLSFLHISLNSLNLLSGQLVLLSILTSGIGVCMAIVADETFLRILPYYLLSIGSLYLFFSVSGFVDCKRRREILKINLIDYLENHMLARLNHQEPISNNTTDRTEKKNRISDAALNNSVKVSSATENSSPEQFPEETNSSSKKYSEEANSSSKKYSEDELESLLKELFI